VQPARQLRLHKTLQDLLVGTVRDPDAVEFIGLHKFIENISTQHHGPGYLDHHIGKLVEEIVFGNHRIDKSQSACLTPNGLFPDA